MTDEMEEAPEPEHRAGDGEGEEDCLPVGTDVYVEVDVERAGTDQEREGEQAGGEFSVFVFVQSHGLVTVEEIRERQKGDHGGLSESRIIANCSGSSSSSHADVVKWLGNMNLTHLPVD